MPKRATVPQRIRAMERELTKALNACRVTDQVFRYADEALGSQNVKISMASMVVHKAVLELGFAVQYVKDARKIARMDK